MTDHPLNWLKVVLHHPPATAEAVSELLFELGARGLWEDPPDQQGRLVTLAGFAPADRPALEEELPKLIVCLAEAFELAETDFDFRLSLEQDHDWAEKWKEGLAPIEIGPGLAVAPTWWPEDDLPRAEVLLRIDPGLAFGSGHHATTRLCLAGVEAQARRAKRILDVGAGSGILSLAAAALNPAAEVIGVDNDPDTLPVARENAEANGLAGRVDFSVRPLTELAPPFDLILANITSNPLMELAPGLTALAAEGTRLVLSGLPESQAEEVFDFYFQLGWRADEAARHQDGWVARTLVRGRTDPTEP